MICAINNYGTDRYAGMSIAESAAVFMNEVDNTIHEYEIATLVAENAYLMENGHPIQYTDSEGYVTEAGSEALAGVKAFFANIIEKIKAFFEHVAQWVGDALDQAKSKLATLGVSKEKFQQLKQKFLTELSEEAQKISVKAGALKEGIKESDFVQAITNVDYKQFFRGAGEYDNSSKIKAFVDKYIVDTAKEGVKLAGDKIDAAADAVFGKRGVISQIMAAKNNAIKEVKAIIKDDNSTPEMVEQAKQHARDISAAASALIKTYSMHISSQISIVIAVIKKAGSKAVNNTKKAVARGAEDAKDAISDKVYDAKVAVARGAVDVASKAADAIKDGKLSRKEKRVLAKEAKKAEKNVKEAKKNIVRATEDTKAKIFRIKRDTKKAVARGAEDALDNAKEKAEDVREKGKGFLDNLKIHK